MFIDWLTIKNQIDSVCADVACIRQHSLVPHDIPVYGYIYDVKTGSLMEVTEPMKISKAA